jgi:hypothetical protein
VIRPNSGKPIDRRDAYRMVARIAKTASPALSPADGRVTVSIT